MDEQIVSALGWLLWDGFEGDGATGLCGLAGGIEDLYDDDIGIE